MAFVAAAPSADPEPKAKPGLIAAAYSAPVVAAPVAYSAYPAYSAPLVSAYSAPVVSTYHGVAPGVAAYSAPLIL